MNEIIEAYDNYIKLLNEELSELASVAAVRGWKSTRVEEGKQLREKIEQAKRDYELECKSRDIS